MAKGDRLVEKLILYIVDQIQNEGARPSLIRLAKLMYLMEVEHYREYGRTLTNLQWFFHKYGPWAFALPSILRHADIDLGEEEYITQEGHTARTFSVAYPQDIANDLSFGAKLVVDRIIRAWALEPTNFLLGYVYFHTEPMVNAKRGERLRFETIARDVADDRVQTRIPTADADDLRQRILGALAQLSTTVVSVPDLRDEAYSQAVELMNQEARFKPLRDDSPDASPEILELLRGE